MEFPPANCMSQKKPEAFTAAMKKGQKRDGAAQSRPDMNDFKDFFTCRLRRGSH